MVYDRCSAAVEGMHGAFSESGGLYGAGANRGEGMDEYIMDRPEDRASAMWKHMCAQRDREHSVAKGSKGAPRCDWNYVGGVAEESLVGGGGAARGGGTHRGGGRAAVGDVRKRSLAQMSGMWGMADTRPHKSYHGAGCASAKMTNSVDSSLRPDLSKFIERPHRRARLDEPDMALSEASTTAP